MAATVVVVGMRGAGKSTLGRRGAAARGATFVDMDEALEAAEGRSCGELVAQRGWDGFRAAELACLRAQLAAHPRDAVIACGGGIVETQPARELLVAHDGPVVHVERDVEDVVEYLEAKEQAQAAAQAATAQEVSEAESLHRRPKYGESVRDVWARRKPFFDAVSTHHFSVARGDKDWEAIAREFETMLLAIFAPESPPTFAPGAILRSVSAAALGALAADGGLRGADGVLVRECRTPEALAQARRASARPLILACGGDASMAAVGMRQGAAFVQVDSVAVARAALELCPRWVGTTRFVVSLAPARAGAALSARDLPDDLESLLPRLACAGLVLQAAQLARVAAVELVGALRARHPAMALAVDLGPGAQAEGAAGILAALCLAHAGPVIEREPAGAAAVAATCRGVGLEPVGFYCLFGHPIQLSPSPAMHNAGFEALGLAKHYAICDTLDERRVAAVLASERFQGASVTIPHKEVVGKYLDELSEAASRIGAVNTVVRLADGRLRGDNTDWFGIFNLVRGPLAQRRAAEGREDGGTALVVGAGGTALSASYCARQLGLALVVFNRTIAKAERVAQRFGGEAVADLAALGKVDVIISTVPATSQFRMPEAARLGEHRPIVVDAAYRPRRTALLQQAEAAGCVTFEGIDMLVEQGLRQMEIWTSRTPPREAMDGAARAFYDLTDPARVRQ